MTSIAAHRRVRPATGENGHRGTARRRRRRLINRLNVVTVREQVAFGRARGMG